jgi:outer membrane protein assembly factor BamE (lipoprotein component of BamABCDE complex)
MKVQRILWVVAVIAVFALISCATAGRQFDRTHINDIKTGAQNKDQIRDWFGKPYQVQSISGSPAGCVERWTYVHAYASYGGAKKTSAALVVDFDRGGKVCDHAYTEN